MIGPLQDSSFSQYLADSAPYLLPGHGDCAVQGVGESGWHASAPHGTTIAAATFGQGVVIAGDRRATAGSLIASHDITKVFVTDEHSAVGIAGTAGLAVELVKLFGVELEHFAKIEGVPLSVDGKANRLATMLRAQMTMAMRGLPVLPLFVASHPAGDRRVARSASPGRIFTYDVTGGCYEEHDFHSIGSGAMFARGSLKKTWRPGLGADEAVRVLIEALVDAADDDSATGGPDLARGIWPTCAVVTPDGAEEVSPQKLEGIVTELLAARRQRQEGRA
ncbi:proteasome subunit beta [Dermatophilus congolensis]|uniref:Proteasome subunit beta n=1 Tax=Dermatophilus congolensis TaxID=1863 RepID=A0AA46BN08_9MICO|nr:proteasome subunit beta [Dermatophilus congolensis]MBO3142830.1 proteasome subunit beta [Dermatophilus congolensis]MBO3151823.1 proteasome subunit beta [Dermatophilus congolensis]MBO3161174.1 proteasome subunit beta [Dermatophilus congolensis]MBO3163105.1 proteasome subunit beta [Dermatophilus congolensis]MBO3176659.1 proteasome subunit beta [Dermatophilus congolensis]